MTAIRGGFRWVAALIGALLLFMGTEVLCAVCVTLFAATRSPGLPYGASDLVLISTLVAQILLFVVGVFWYRNLRFERSFRPIDYGKGRFEGPEAAPVPAHRSLRHILAKVLLLLLLGVCLQIVISSLLSLVALVLPHLMDSYNEMMEGVAGTSWLSVVSVALLAPLCEEVYFRGVCLQLARRIHPDLRVAVIAQALVFAIAHGNLVQGLYAFFLGIILGAVVLRAGGLPASMVLHFAINMSSYSVGLAFDEMAGSGLPGYIALIALAAVATVTLLRVLLRRQGTGSSDR